MDRPKTVNPIDEQTCVHEKSPSMCDRHDLKLKEAEKTIANKDVIIQMLQNQVKKLETSYKQNLEQTEMFRYKFYVVSDQVKKMRGACPRTKEKPKQMMCDVDKRNYDKEHLTPKCRYIEQMKNVEKHLQDHNELLQTLVEKISGKTNDESDSKVEKLKAEYLEQINKLEETIRDLKDKNDRLQNELSKNDSEISLVVKDSLLDAYKRTNMELQRKMSNLLEKVESESSQESLTPSKDAPRSMNRIKSVTLVGRTKVKKISPRSNSEDEEENLPTKLATDDENKPVKVNKCVCTETPESDKPDIIDKINELTQKLNDVEEKVTLFGTQACTKEDNDSLMKELTLMSNATQAYKQNLSELLETISEYKEIVSCEFREHKNISNNLLQSNEEIKYELKELMNKIELIWNTLKTLSLSERTVTSSSEVITIDQCKAKIYSDQNESIQSVGIPTMYQAPQVEKELDNKEEATKSDDLLSPCPSESSDNKKQIEPEKILVQNNDNCVELEEVSKLKDEQIKSIRSLICYYALARKQILKIHYQAPPIENQTTDVIEQVKDENFKPKTSISAVIDNLSEKIDELKTAQEGPCRCTDSDVHSNTTEPLVCSCDLSSNDSNCTSDIEENMKTDIENIYNVVRRTFTSQCQPGTSSSSVCICHKINTKLSDNDKNSCHSGKNNQGSDERPLVGSNKSRDKTTNSASTPKDIPCDGEIIKISSDHSCCSHCKNETLIASLQQYLRYLNEQLNTITVIENRIEDVKSTIKNP